MSTKTTGSQDAPVFGSLLAEFQPTAPDGPDTEELFCTTTTLRVQAPGIRNDYKKCAGSSDGGRTYDTTAV